LVLSASDVKKLLTMRDVIGAVQQTFPAYGEGSSKLAPVINTIDDKYNLKINSSKFADRLMKERSTLIVPADHFGMDGYLRIGYGPPKDYLYAGLNKMDELVEDIKRRK
jgi:aspartate/methionine/tyrosine aminotransferase